MKKVLFTSLLILFVLSVSAQFNTLILAEKEVPSESLEKDEILITNRKNKKKKVKRKKSLQRENDSLRSLLDYYDSRINLESRLLLQSIEARLLRKPDTESSRSVRESNLAMPLSGELIVTSSYGNRIHPIDQKPIMHNGVDYKANHEPVYAVLNGVINKVNRNKDKNGNYISIQHSGSWETLYLHLSKIMVKEGDLVKAGDTIAISGNSGQSTGPHLHFSVKENGRFIDPAIFLNQLQNINHLISSYYEN